MPCNLCDYSGHYGHTYGSCDKIENSSNKKINKKKLITLSELNKKIKTLEKLVDKHIDRLEKLRLKKQEICKHKKAYKVNNLESHCPTCDKNI